MSAVLTFERRKPTVFAKIRFGEFFAWNRAVFVRIGMDTAVCVHGIQTEDARHLRAIAVSSIELGAIATFRRDEPIDIVTSVNITVEDTPDED